MEKEITKLANCLKAMRKCLAIPRVENCVCYSNAMKVIEAAVKELRAKNAALPVGDKTKFKSLAGEFAVLKKKVAKGPKDCLGCKVCMAAVVFKAYPGKLDALYLDGKL